MKTLKTPFAATIKRDKFDLKILLAGGAGSGKTHLCGTYTKGPIHFYMIDKGGEVTLEKLVAGRPDNAPLTVDILSASDITLLDIWTKIQQDEKDGFFDYLAETNGIVVFDSITNLAIKGNKDIAKTCGITPPSFGKKADSKKKFSFVHWDQSKSWIMTIINTIQDLPCASIATIHLMTMTDSEGAVICRKPLLQGSMRDIIDIDFTEVYLCDTKNNKHQIYMQKKGKFDAKSKAFSCNKLEDTTLDIIANTYMNGKVEIK